MNREQIAVFGSAFNPPHLGHADVIQQILQHTQNVVLVPSFQHAFGKEMMPYARRLRMLNAMLNDLGLSQKVVVSVIEEEIARNKANQGLGSQPIYTYDVLDALERHFQTSALVFVVGPDNASPETLKRFYKSDVLVQRWQLWAAEERLDVRSTAIRKKLARGDALSESECTPGVIKLLQSGGGADE